MNNFKPVIILEPGGRRKPGIYEYISVPVLLVPAGEEGRVWRPSKPPEVGGEGGGLGGKEGG